MSEKGAGGEDGGREDEDSLRGGDGRGAGELLGNGGERARLDPL